MRVPVRIGIVLLLLTITTQTGCERLSTADLDSDSAEVVSTDFTDQVLAATQVYLKYPLASLDAGVAPVFCAAMSKPTSAKLSQSGDADSHGRKIYYLFTKDDADYNLGQGAAPVGQVIVKESWVARQVEEPDYQGQQHASGNQVNPVAWKDNKAYIAEEKGPLFVMLKLEPQTAGTDQGWVYATLTPDGKEVTAAGKLQNCMSCHVDARRDRQFGLRYKAD